MPMNKSAMAAGIVANMMARNPQIATQSGAQAKLQADMEALCDAIITHIASFALVSVNPGIPVATAGSPTAQTGATTSPGTGTIS